MVINKMIYHFVCIANLPETLNSDNTNGKNNVDTYIISYSSYILENGLALHIIEYSHAPSTQLSFA